RSLLRDPRAAVILVVMPLLFILVLGVSLGEGFGQKPDDRLRVSLVDLDEGPETSGGVVLGAGLRLGARAAGAAFPPNTWAQVVRDDLRQTAGIRVEDITSRAEAERLVRSGRRAAVLVFGPDFSKQVGQASFLKTGLNPFHRDGVNLQLLDLEI